MSLDTREAAASDARTGLGAAPVAVQRAPRALPLLRPAAQLAPDEPGSTKSCVVAGTSGASSPEPAAAHVARFQQLLACFPLPSPSITHPARPMPDASFNLGRSRVRESRSLGSVGAKAEWLSYPTNPGSPPPIPGAVPAAERGTHRRTHRYRVRRRDAVGLDDRRVKRNALPAALSRSDASPLRCC